MIKIGGNDAIIKSYIAILCETCIIAHFYDHAYRKYCEQQKLVEKLFEPKWIHH